MHRFGRSAQQKMKDRWGGGFILATILAIVGAWFAGQWLNGASKGVQTTDLMNSSGTAQSSDGVEVSGHQQAATVSQEFKLYLLQVGAFRSEASAQNLVHSLAEKGFTAMVAPRSATGFHKVYAGLYTSLTAANDAKTRLTADGSFSDAHVAGVTVPHNPEAIPTTALTGKGPDLRKGLEAMNTYLQTAATWIEGQSSGVQGDATVLAERGKALNQLAQELSKAAPSNSSLQPFAQMATTASANATALQSAATAGPASAEYQAALRDYLAVLDQYRSLQTGNAAKP